MAITSGPYSEENNEIEYTVEDFQGPLSRHEYLHSEVILNLGDETYRVRVNEEDENLYLDAWEGEINGRNFEPLEYVNHTRTNSDSKMPSNFDQVNEILSEQENTEADSVVEFINQSV